ncbi:Mss4-like protein [Blastocladiella britannica]|nr:Mss4-like protein [Blastocladiella britannica]
MATILAYLAQVPKSTLASGPTPKDGMPTCLRVYCPNARCKCLILRQGDGTFVSKRDVPFDIPALPAGTVPTATVDNDRNVDALPSDEADALYIEVRDMMHFENIGFSKTVADGLKFLSCADCDLGPLGFQQIGPNVYGGCFVKADRVRYQLVSAVTSPQ